MSRSKCTPIPTLLFYENTLDNVKGTCASRSLLDLLIENRLTSDTLLERIEQPFFVIEGTLLSRLMTTMQNNPSSSLILVLSEYDRVQGLLTREDILKRINPDLMQSDNTLLRREGPQTWIADASMRVKDLNTALQLELPLSDNLTLNGLITTHLESIPQKGVATQINNVSFEVIKAIKNQIQLIRIRLPDSPPPE